MKLNSMGKITNWLKRPRNAIVAGALTLGTITGTYMGNEGGLSPLYTVKTGTSYGINLGFFTDFREGARHYGINMSFCTFFTGGELNGINASLISGATAKDKFPKNCPIRESKTRGLELSLINMDENGLHKMYGLQIGIGNQNGGGTNAQVGIYNEAGKKDDTSRGVLLNFHRDLTKPKN